jgi:hypothetical protein
LNNFGTERDKKKMSADYLHKSQATESNGDAITSLPRTVVAETTSGRNLGYQKIMKKSQTVVD